MKHGKSFKISASLILILFMLLFLPVSLSACSKAANEEASNDVAKKSSEPKRLLSGFHRIIRLMTLWIQKEILMASMWK